MKNIEKLISIKSGLLGTVLLLMIASTVYDVFCTVYNRKRIKMNSNNNDDDVCDFIFKSFP